MRRRSGPTQRFAFGAALLVGALFGLAPNTGSLHGAMAAEPGEAEPDRGLTGSYDENNPFARILRGELPAFKVYEDDYTLAFVPLRMRSHGHTLVIPKAKVRNLLQINPSDLAHVMETVQKVARAEVAVFGAEGVTLVQNNGEAGDQSVFHLHFHVIPRYPGAALGPPPDEDDPPDARREVANKLSAYFNANPALNPSRR